MWRSETSLPSNPPVPASRFLRTTSKSCHLRKQGTADSINNRLHQPQPYWAVPPSTHHAKASSSTTRLRIAASMAWAWSAANILLGSQEQYRPVLALLAENALRARSHDPSAVFPTRARARFGCGGRRGSIGALVKKGSRCCNAATRCIYRYGCPQRTSAWFVLVGCYSWKHHRESSNPSRSIKP